MDSSSNASGDYIPIEQKTLDRKFHPLINEQWDLDEVAVNEKQFENLLLIDPGHQRVLKQHYKVKNNKLKLSDSVSSTDSESSPLSQLLNNVYLCSSADSKHERREIKRKFKTATHKKRNKMNTVFLTDVCKLKKRGLNTISSDDFSDITSSKDDSNYKSDNELLDIRSNMKTHENRPQLYPLNLLTEGKISRKSSEIRIPLEPKQFIRTLTAVPTSEESHKISIQTDSLQYNENTRFEEKEKKNPFDSSATISFSKSARDSVSSLRSKSVTRKHKSEFSPQGIKGANFSPRGMKVANFSPRGIKVANISRSPTKTSSTDATDKFHEAQSSQIGTKAETDSTILVPMTERSKLTETTFDSDQTINVQSDRERLLENAIKFKESKIAPAQTLQTDDGGVDISGIQIKENEVYFPLDTHASGLRVQIKEKGEKKVDQLSIKPGFFSRDLQVDASLQTSESLDTLDISEKKQQQNVFSVPKLGEDVENEELLNTKIIPPHTVDLPPESIIHSQPMIQNQSTGLPLSRSQTSYQDTIQDSYHLKTYSTGVQVKLPDEKSEVHKPVQVHTQIQYNPEDIDPSVPYPLAPLYSNQHGLREQYPQHAQEMQTKTFYDNSDVPHDYASMNVPISKTVSPNDVYPVQERIPTNVICEHQYFSTSEVCPCDHASQIPPHFESRASVKPCPSQGTFFQNTLNLSDEHSKNHFIKDLSEEIAMKVHQQLISKDFAQDRPTDFKSMEIFKVPESSDIQEGGIPMETKDYGEVRAQKINVVVENRAFPSLKTRLAEESDWFAYTFQLIDETRPVSYIEIPIIKASVYEIIFEWIQSKEIKLTFKNVCSVYIAAQQLLMTGFKKVCEEFAEANDIPLPQEKPPSIPYPQRGIFEGKGKVLENFAEKTKNIVLEPSAFPEIVQSPDFFALHPKTLYTLLNEDYLNIKSELEVFDAAIAWLSYDWPHRVSYSAQILGCVRFYLLTDGDLVDLFYHPKNLVAIALPACRDLILKAYLYKSAAKSQELDRLKLPFGNIRKRYSLKPLPYFKISPWQAAIIIQAAWRGYRTRRYLAIRHGAAAVIQAAYRGHLIRCWLMERERANKQLQKALQLERECQNRAAIKIQAYYRGYYVRKHFKKMGKSAITIQKSVRCFLAKRQIQRAKIEKRTDATILLLGGVSEQFNTSCQNKGMKCFIYLPKKDKWSVFTHLKEPVHYGKAAFLGGRIFIAGGCVPNLDDPEKIEPSNRVWRLDVYTGSWEKIAEMRHRRIHHILVTSHRRLYAIGGQDEKKKILSSTEMYDSKSNMWYEMSPMNLERSGLSGVPYKECIIVCGGIQNDKSRKTRGIITDSVEIYYPTKDKWVTTNPLRIPRCFATLSEYMGELFLIGGVVFSSSLKGSSAAVDFYDPESQQWYLLTELQLACHCPIVFFQEDYLVVAGGLSSLLKRGLDSGSFYNLKEDKWSKGDCFTLPCVLNGAATVSLTYQIAVNMKGVNWT